MKKIESIGESRLLEEQKFFFRFYLILPLIIAIIVLVGFFGWGIGDPCVFREYHSGSYFSESYHTYGIMGCRTGFGCWLIWTLIGVIVGGIVYIFLKFLLSYKILQICYLDKICSKLCGEDNEQANDIEEKQEIEEVVFCKNCGNQIFADETKCSNCGAERDK